MEPFAVFLPILHIDVRTDDLLHPLEWRVAGPVPSEPHFVNAGLAAIDAVETNVVVDSRKGRKAEVRIVCVHLSHVIHDPSEMGDLGEWVFVGSRDGRRQVSLWLIDQGQCVSPALSGRIEICDPAPPRWILPAVLDYQIHAS